MTDHVALAVEGPIATLTLRRPDKLNALTVAMLDALADAAERIEQLPEVRAVVLTAEGTKAFCVGADIEAWAALPPLDMWRRWTRHGHQVFTRLAQLRVPVVAALNGHAIGGGLELAATADLRISEAHARLGLPEAGIATAPGWSGTQRLVRRAGPQAVRRLALVGDLIDAETALAWGLVDQVVETGTGLARALAVAERIARQAPVSVQVVKQMINVAEGEATLDTLEQFAGALTAFTEDAAEGLVGFRNKQPPEFKGR
ncbi:MAG: enoyl-CoA hydratase/isomerase family protein [Geminicoccaceae bacterium]|nr:MAG: enoyl-CoA hydratase/isomerase family protein [Geminicoccaceae bacterium]